MLRRNFPHVLACEEKPHTGRATKMTPQINWFLIFNTFSSVQFAVQLGCRGNMTDDSAEILFQSFLQEALLSSSGMGRDVHSLMLSIQHFICLPRGCRASKMR